MSRPSDIRWLEDQIKSLSPPWTQPFFQSHLFEPLKREALEHQRTDEDLYVDLLLRIYVVQLGVSSERKSKEAAGWYWQERGKIDQMLMKLSEHPLIKWFDRGAIELYGPTEVDCEHGRRRKDCGRLLSLLQTRERIRTLVDRSQRAAFPGVQKKMQTHMEELTRDIQKINERQPTTVRIDPENWKPEGFCSTISVDTLAECDTWVDAERPEKDLGRPIMRHQYDLLEALGERLHAIGLPKNKAVAYVAKSLIYCFPGYGPPKNSQQDIEEWLGNKEANLVDNLLRQWREYRKRASTEPFSPSSPSDNTTND